MLVVPTKIDVTTTCLGISSDDETGVGVMRPATPDKIKLRLYIGSIHAGTIPAYLRNHGHLAISKL